MKNWMKVVLGMVLAILLGLAIFFGCASADKNITAKDYKCEKLTQENAMSCCLQNMSSKSGSDSKDAICRPLVDELREKFREERKKNNLIFCSQAPEEYARSCWDKLNSK